MTNIFLTSLFSTVSAQTSPSEANCGYCHVNNYIIHHTIINSLIPNPTDAPYGTPGNQYECLSCHATKTSCGKVIYIIETDCAVCHVYTDPHHTSAPSSCASCHEVDRPADPHPQIRDCLECHLDVGNSWLGANYDHSPGNHWGRNLKLTDSPGTAILSDDFILNSSKYTANHKNGFNVGYLDGSVSWYINCGNAVGYIPNRPTNWDNIHVVWNYFNRE